MKHFVVLLGALALTGCAGLGSSLDQAAARQNEANVRQIVGENEAYLVTDQKPESLKAIQRDRNAAAVDLAEGLGR